MPIISNEIQYRLSGGAANTDDEASIGGAKSSNAISGTLLDDVAGAGSLSGETNYRCFYVHNNNGTLAYQNAVIWLQAQTLGAGHAIAIGVGAAAVNGTETAIANESTAPAGVSFSTPTTQGAALSLGSIPAGQHRAVWVRRIVTAASIASSNTYTLRTSGETAP